MEAQAVLENYLKSLGFDPSQITVPRFVQVPDVEQDKCMNNCIQYCKKNPKWCPVLGWSIVQIGHATGSICSYFTFFFHAVLKHKKNGTLVDITPTYNNFNFCLFIPDPRITYEMYYSIREIPSCVRLMPVLRSVGECTTCRNYVVEQSLKIYTGNEVPREKVCDILECFNLVNSLEEKNLVFIINEEEIGDIVKSVEKTVEENGVNWFEK